jgi:hypothetical protein
MITTWIYAQAYWDGYHHYGLWKPKCVFTIHNAEFGLDRIGMAAYYCQRFTTVSPSYAFEVQAHAMFMHVLLACALVRSGCVYLCFTLPVHIL